MEVGWTMGELVEMPQERPEGLKDLNIKKRIDDYFSRQ